MRYALTIVALLALSGCAGTQNGIRSNDRNAGPNATEPGAAATAVEDRPRESWLARRLHLDRLWRRDPAPAASLAPAAPREVQARAGRSERPTAELQLPDGKEDRDDTVAGHLRDQSVRTTSRHVLEDRPGPAPLPDSAPEPPAPQVEP